ncbi:MAG: imidazolonepropionase [Acidobacteria bacterium]|nr:MAG: imidazolonepropionase [Acidobacteriota bacterium]
MRRESFFYRNAAELLTLAGGPCPRRGPRLSELGIIRGGGLLTRGENISRIGRSAALEAEARRTKAQEVDCRGRVLMPGFVDCHTHLVFAGNRIADFERRIRGGTYLEIARAGGGIEYTAARTRRAREAELVQQAQEFLEQFAAHGTTTVEVKSGYGLDVPTELKILKAVRRLSRRTPLDLAPTLLAAHALPPEYARRRGAYLARVVRELIPRAAQKKLAEFADCFADRGAFTAAECGAVLQAARRHGLVPRIHAEQLSRTGAIQLAVQLGAASADHLDFANAADIRALAQSEVVAVLVPGSNFFLGVTKLPPARRLIDAGAAVALATDFNPGTCPTLNMQFILSLATTQLRMTPAEAISAATLNAGHALRRAGQIGSLEPGKLADLALMDVSDYREIPYFFGWNHCVMTVKKGQIIYQLKN